jgi:hypothetical protein
MTATEYGERQIAVAVVIAVEKTLLLMPVQWVVGGVEVESDLRWRRRMGVAEQLDKQRFDRCRVIADLVIAGRLRGSRPSRWWRFGTVVEASWMPRRRWKFGFAVHAAAASDRRQGGLCCGHSAAIKPCASGAPRRGGGARQRHRGRAFGIHAFDGAVGSLAADHAAHGIWRGSAGSTAAVSSAMTSTCR